MDDEFGPICGCGYLALREDGTCGRAACEYGACPSCQGTGKVWAMDPVPMKPC